MNERKIAEERIDVLFEQADLKVKKRPDLSKRYMLLAKKLAMRYQISLSREQRSKVCKKCGSYLKIGHNATVRISRKGGTHRLIVCKGCGKEKRLMLLGLQL